jgi:hypothetical protein
MSFCRRWLLLGQLCLSLIILHAQDSNVVPRAEESQQIPGPRCHFIPDEDTARARLCTPVEIAACIALLGRYPRRG